MATAAAVYTTPPLRKVYDVLLATGGSAGGDTNTIAIAHGIDFTDNLTAASRQVQVVAVPQSNAATTPAYGAIADWIVDATNLTIAFYAPGAFAAGNVRLHIQRVHSFQG